MFKYMFLLGLLMGVSLGQVDVYDYVVVGGGTAGSAFASTLAVETNHRILVLESGDDNSNVMSHIVGFYGGASSGATPDELPLTASINAFVEQKYSQEKNMGFRSLLYPIPNTFGGGSMVNGNAFSRATAVDFEAWNNSLWTYNSTLDAWKYLEDCKGPSCDPQFHGVGGPIVTNTFGSNPLTDALAQQIMSIFNLPRDDDVNDETNYGVGLLPRNIDISSGAPIRQDSYTKMLAPLKGSSGLDVLSGADVLKVTLKPGGGVYVDYVHQGIVKRAFALREVAMAAGNLNTPRLLMLSGIGDCDYLASIGIQCQVNNTEVGKNLKDSAMTPLIYYSPDPTPLSPNPLGSIAVAYYNSSFYNGTGNDFEIAFGPLTPNGKVMMILIAHLQSGSQGEVKLKSSNPNVDPFFRFNLYPTQDSMLPMIDNIRKARQAAAAVGLYELSPGFVTLPLTATDAAYAQYITKVVTGMYHAVGSCSMNKVVNGELKLINANGSVVPGIRIVDISVIPRLLGSHATSSSAMLIGTKAALMVAAQKA